MDAPFCVIPMPVVDGKKKETVLDLRHAKISVGIFQLFSPSLWTRLLVFQLELELYFPSRKHI